MAVSLRRVERRLGEQEGTAVEKKGRFRLALAALVVVSGVAVITPSLVFDSDHDGVGDSVEVYQLGTDPSSADIFDNSAVVATKRANQ